MASDTSNSDKQNFATQPAPETVVPVVSEQFLVGKRAVPAGGVRVHNRVDQQIEKVDIPVTKERVRHPSRRDRSRRR